MKHGSLVLAVLMATASAAQEPPPPTAPLGPGTIALHLAQQGPEALAAVTAGLGDSRAAVRSAAARTALMLGNKDAAAALERALGGETDLDAAVEEVYALAVLGGPPADTALLDAAARLRPALAPHVADALARTRGGAALLLIPRLRPLGLESLDSMVRIATAGHADALVPPAARAVGAADDGTWRALLQAAADARYAMPESLLVASITSSAPAVRQATYEHVAETAAAMPPAEAIRAALTAAPDKAVADEQSPPPDSAAAAAAFAWELAARAAGAKAQPRESLLRTFPVASGEATPTPSTLQALNAFLARPPLRRLLTAGEQRALTLALGDDGLPVLPPPVGSVREPMKPAGAHEPDIRMASGLPAGLASEVVKASGCTSREGAAAAEVHYWPDGRTRSVSILTAPAGKGCREAATALFASALAPSWRLPKAAPEALILKFDDEALACQDESAHGGLGDRAGSGRPKRVGAKIKEPRKLRNVPPVYPDAAQRDRVEGVVILEATISRSGCVRELRTLRGHGMLTAAALSAVAGWRYTPTLLDGVAVPVIMTVTVNFRLR